MNRYNPRFRTNSIADRLGRLSGARGVRYMELRDEGKTIKEALDIAAPIEEPLVLNTNPGVAKEWLPKKK